MPHHIIVNSERLVLSHLPKRGEAPPLDEVGAGEQCDDCGSNVVDTLEYVTARKVFVCSTCHAEYPVRDGGYVDDEPIARRALRDAIEHDIREDFNL